MPSTTSFARSSRLGLMSSASMLLERSNAMITSRLRSKVSVFSLPQRGWENGYDEKSKRETKQYFRRAAVGTLRWLDATEACGDPVCLFGSVACRGAAAVKERPKQKQAWYCQCPQEFFMCPIYAHASASWIRLPPVKTPTIAKIAAAYSG